MGICTTRSSMANILSWASRRSSNSRYLSQKGCARKSSPTQPAPLSKSLPEYVSAAIIVLGREVQQGKRQRAANMKCIVLDHPRAPLESIKHQYRSKICVSTGRQRMSERNESAWLSMWEEAIWDVVFDFLTHLETESDVSWYIIVLGQKARLLSLVVMGRKPHLELLTLEWHRRHDWFRLWKHNNLSIDQQSWLCLQRPAHIPALISLSSLIHGKAVKLYQLCSLSSRDRKF